MTAKRERKLEAATVEEFDAMVEFIVRWADGVESVQPPLPFDQQVAA